MIKIGSLRQLLRSSCPFVATDPAKLAIYVDKGRLVARGGGPLSFEYRYTAVLVLEAYAGDPDHLFVPLLAWVAEHEPELLDRDPREPFTFESEILGDLTADITIEIELSERVVVRRSEAGLVVDHLPEPPRADAFDAVAPGTALLQGIARDLLAGDVAIVPA